MNWGELATITALAYAGALYILKLVVEAAVNQRFDKALEDYRLELKIREQAVSIATYAAIAHDLKADDSRETYQKANELSWQLFLLLPEDIYKKLGNGLIHVHDREQLVHALTDVRRMLLGEKAGSLGPDNIIVHAPNIGRTQPTIPI